MQCIKGNFPLRKNEFNGKIREQLQEANVAHFVPQRKDRIEEYIFFDHKLRPVQHKSKEGKRYPERVEWKEVWEAL